jgi:ketosteroid isomerase-like protein
MDQPRANRHVVQRAYDALLANDAGGILARFAEDCRIRSAGNPDLLPFAGRFEGHAGLVVFLCRQVTAFERLAFRPEEFHAFGDRVLATGRERVRIRANGREAELGWAHVFALRDGLITEFRGWSDTAALLEAMRWPRW